MRGRTNLTLSGRKKCLGVMELEEILRQVDRQRRQNLVIGILVIILLGFLAFIKDRDLDKRVFYLEQWKAQQLYFNEQMLGVK